ncbi:thiamine biosynthesis protein ThiS [Lottiidibacillus patelloidae]|uniref:Thiamine biosynthesis protein ThiS n=1 Tax=Lottiidibacillus patelloidae TaxID=2670334 RepID=A0A263BV96_9BACI|nr:sulfur carrier protein ThiS [Lottiidibacillus patelloidae]OZM57673.1 thiamine biosynthesis protein ThiS [Lottiidibacillus patelloidae]
MNVTINGEKKVVTALTISELLEELQLNPGLIVIEIDGEIIDRSNWNEELIKEDINIEIVHFVGGG